MNTTSIGLLNNDEDVIKLTHCSYNYSQAWVANGYDDLGNLVAYSGLGSEADAHDEAKTKYSWKANETTSTATGTAVIITTWYAVSFQMIFYMDVTAGTDSYLFFNYGTSKVSATATTNSLKTYKGFGIAFENSATTKADGSSKAIFATDSDATHVNASSSGYSAIGDTGFSSTATYYANSSFSPVTFEPGENESASANWVTSYSEYYTTTDASDLTAYGGATSAYNANTTYYTKGTSVYYYQVTIDDGTDFSSVKSVLSLFTGGTSATIDSGTNNDGVEFCIQNSTYTYVTDDQYPSASRVYCRYRLY